MRGRSRQRAERARPAALRRAPDRSAAGRAGETPRGGVDHIALSIRCDDLGKVAGALRRRGVTVDGDVVPRRGAFGTGPSLYVRDPEGYRLELKPR